MSTLSIAWKDFETTRNLIAFFFLGLSNNFGYVIMLSAAYDLLHLIDKMSPSEEHETGFLRQCNVLSTGAVLVANIVPCTIIKLISAFLPLMIHVRMAVVVLTAAIGLVCVATAMNKYYIICGICFVSFSCGLGESSLLSYTVFFRTKNVLSTWCSGTGMAGLLGAFSYSSMVQIGFTPQMTILVMLCMPCTMAISFWFIIERPMFNQFEHDKADLEMLRIERRKKRREIHKKQLAEGEKVEELRSSMTENVQTIPTILLTYTIWYGLVYFFEYFINQGIFELVYIPKSFLDHSAQYRWFNTVYQLGVFLSRSSMNLLTINRIYLLAVLQGVNVVIFLTEALIGYISYLEIVLVIIFWEGLLGGACYVNTFRRIMKERPRESRDFAMAINAIGDSIMISLAGLIAIPVHNALCKTHPTYGLAPHVERLNGTFNLSTTVLPPS
ncbi:CLN3 protein [Nesidiocoris tenuis]|nr:CLN3 protein [Nesidiocoris tenuis]